MENIYQMDIDGFEIYVEIHKDYGSEDFEIVQLYDGNFEPLETEISDMILEDNEDAIIEEIWDRTKMEEGY